MKKHRPTTKIIAYSAEMLTKSIVVIAAAAMVLAVSALLLPPIAQADEAALYDKAPNGSAFVRLINISDAPFSVQLGDTQLSTKEYCQASSYTYLPHGEYHVDNSAIQWNGNLRENKIYSLVVGNNGTSLFEHERFKDARKGLLAVYNLSSQQLAITATHSKKTVFPNLSKNAYIARKVNPIKIQLSIQQGEHIPLDTRSVIFQSGITSSLLVCDNPTSSTEDQLVSSWVNN